MLESDHHKTKGMSSSVCVAIIGERNGEGASNLLNLLHGADQSSETAVVVAKESQSPFIERSIQFQLYHDFLELQESSRPIAAVVVALSELDEASLSTSTDLCADIPSSTAFCVTYRVGSNSAAQHLEASLQSRNSFYGLLKVDEDRDHVAVLIELLLEMIWAPFHSLWNSREDRLSTRAIAQLRRCFWLFDADEDGLLSGSEFSEWCRATRGEDHGALLNEAMQLLRSGSQSWLAGESVRIEGVLAVCHALLKSGRSSELWRLLRSVGVQRDLLPYTPADSQFLESVRPTARLSLSLLGEQFFRKVYRKLSRSKTGIWDFVVNPPILKAYNSDDIQSEDEFAAYWQVTALRDSHSLVRFARVYGFKGDPTSLFSFDSVGSSKSETSSTRLSHVIVVGGKGCGKSSIVERVCDFTFTLPTKEVVGCSNLDPEDRKWIVVSEISDSTQLQRFFSDPSPPFEYDAVLLLIDGTDPYSFGFAKQCHQRLSDSIQGKGNGAGESTGNGSVTPFLFVLTKADLPLMDRVSDIAPVDYCKQAGLLWPPIITSISDVDLPPGIRNEADQLLPMLSEVIQCPQLATVETVSTGRRIRRAVIVAAAVAAVLVIGRKLFRRVRA
jgi:hypothetical protein